MFDLTKLFNRCYTSNEFLMIKFNYILMLSLFLLWGCDNRQQAETSKTFSFEMNFSYPGDPVFVYDHLTGDISEWWDHSLWEQFKPYIEEHYRRH